MHNCFNWLSVLVLLPLEALSGLLRRMSQAVVDTLQLSGGKEAPELLKVLTEPLTKNIIQVPHRHISTRTSGKYFILFFKDDEKHTIHFKLEENGICTQQPSREKGEKEVSLENITY